MNKLAVAIAGMLVGLIVGVLIGYALFEHGAPTPTASDTRHFYYRLNDSVITRHTISHSGNRLNHIVDTLTILPKQN